MASVSHRPFRGNLLNDHADLLPDVADSMPEHKRLADQPYSPPGIERDDDGHDDERGGEEGESNGTTGRGFNVMRDDGSADSDGDGKDSSYATDPSPGRKRDQQPERSIYSNVRLPNLSTNIQRLLREARQLPINDIYATACVLARVILELAVSDPKVLAWSGKKEGDTLPKKIRGCILELDPLIESRKRTRQDLVQAHLETNEIGVTYLHQFMHNPTAKADPHLARRFSAAYTPLLNSINEAVA